MAEKQQLIITIGREYGSGGHVIGERLAGEFGIGFYDSEIILDLAERKGIDPKALSRYDEKPSKILWNRNVRGYSTSREEAVAQMQFHLIRELAESGESFVLIGRCGETVLADMDGLVRFFVLGDRKARVRRIMERNGVSEKVAKKQIKETDKKRKTYHNTYSDGKWRDPRSYDLTINSSRLGLDGTAEIMKDFVEKCIEKR